MLQDYKITDSQRDAINSVSEKANNERMYLEFVQTQEMGFRQVIEFVNSAIYLLKEDFFISTNTTITARIKDLNSAMENYQKNKMLDDVFGIEIIGKSEEELAWIKNSIEKAMLSNKTKNFDKDNGYKAQHESYYPDSKSETARRWKLLSDQVPMVELQFKTEEVATKESASHHNYKETDQKAILEMLKTRVLEIGIDIPRMWISTDGFIRELSYEEIIKKIYPFVDTETIKKKESKNR